MHMQNVRSGNYGVVAANHTLILNWNDQTVPLLRQIALNRTERADDTYDGCATSFLPLKHFGLNPSTWNILVINPKP